MARFSRWHLVRQDIVIGSFSDLDSTSTAEEIRDWNLIQFASIEIAPYTGVAPYFPDIIRSEEICHCEGGGFVDRFHVFEDVVGVFVNDVHAEGGIVLVLRKVSIRKTGLKQTHTE
jgi:hypothetical protein